MAKTLFRRWEVLDKTTFGDGELIFVAWRAKNGGHLVYAGLAQVASATSFPKTIFGGGPGSFKNAKQAFKQIAELPRLTQLQLSWATESPMLITMNTGEDLEYQIELAKKEAIERWGSA